MRYIYSKHVNKAPINFLYSSKFAFYLHRKNTNKGFMDLKKILISIYPLIRSFALQSYVNISLSSLYINAVYYMYAKMAMKAIKSFFVVIETISLKSHFMLINTDSTICTTCAQKKISKRITSFNFVSLVYYIIHNYWGSQRFVYIAI